MNKHNNIYFVLFGRDHYDPDAHFRACRKKFDSLTDARKYAARYINAYIFKAHFYKGDDAPAIFKIN